MPPAPAPWKSATRGIAPSKASSPRAPKQATHLRLPRLRRQRCCADLKRSTLNAPPSPRHIIALPFCNHFEPKEPVVTIHDPSLRAALKTLKLTGMLDTLDARLAQTRDGKLGHLEFLQVLCEDEIARRDTAALARRVRRARFEQHATFEDFDFTVSPKLPAAMLRDLAALRWLEAGESVILYGPVGVGKTQCRTSTRTPSSPPRRRHPVRQMLPNARRPRRRTRRSHHRSTHARIHPTPGPHRRRLRDARAHPDPERRPLRPGLRPRHRRQTADPHQQPRPQGLVPAVPQPRRRRITARPTHQHQPPNPHQRNARLQLTVVLAPAEAVPGLYVHPDHRRRLRRPVVRSEFDV